MKRTDDDYVGRKALEMQPGKRIRRKRTCMLLINSVVALCKIDTICYICHGDSRGIFRWDGSHHNDMVHTYSNIKLSFILIIIMMSNAYIMLSSNFPCLKGKKGSFYIAQYPVRWTAQSALHFLNPLADLFIPTPTRLLREAF